MSLRSLRALERFRIVTRAHVLAWRSTFGERQLAPSTIRRKLAALSSLFEYLCEANAVTGNPVKGVAGPKITSQEGKTPAISDPRPEPYTTRLA